MLKHPRKKYFPGHPLASKRGYVEVDRLVAMEMLGRLLTQDEVVTRRNGDCHDDRPENLEVVSRSELAMRTFREGRTILRGDTHGSWKGGRRKHSLGYILVQCPDHPESKKYDGYVLEHRLVMEGMLGRMLSPEEVVHHINGKKEDNRPENLKVYASQGLHIHEHRQRNSYVGSVR